MHTCGAVAVAAFVYFWDQFGGEYIVEIDIDMDGLVTFLSKSFRFMTGPAVGLYFTRQIHLATWLFG